jgi:hypothetical protein
MPSLSDDLTRAEGRRSFWVSRLLRAHASGPDAALEFYVVLDAMDASFARKGDFILALDDVERGLAEFGSNATASNADPRVAIRARLARFVRPSREPARS